MKKIFVSVFALSCLLGTTKAFATYDDCLNWTAINVDSGKTSVDCGQDNNPGSGTNCTATSLGCRLAWMATSCGTTGKIAGTTATHHRCCVNSDCAYPVQRTEELTSSTQDESLADVYSDRTPAAFYGYINNVVRSPNAGRTLVMDAKLDACIGFTNLDSLITNYGSDPYGGWSACTGSGYCGSVKNAYCTNNSNQVCIDRCNCKYRSALMGLGYADPGCSNL